MMKTGKKKSNMSSRMSLHKQQKQGKRLCNIAGVEVCSVKILLLAFKPAFVQFSIYHNAKTKE